MSKCLSSEQRCKAGVTSQRTLIHVQWLRSSTHQISSGKRCTMGYTTQLQLTALFATAADQATQWGTQPKFIQVNIERRPPNWPESLVPNRNGCEEMTYQNCRISVAFDSNASPAETRTNEYRPWPTWHSRSKDGSFSLLGCTNTSVV